MCVIGIISPAGVCVAAIFSNWATSFTNMHCTDDRLREEIEIPYPLQKIRRSSCLFDDNLWIYCIQILFVVLTSVMVDPLTPIDSVDII